MSTSTYTGTVAALDSQLASIISPETLNKLLDSIPKNADGTYTLGLTNGSQAFNFDSSDFSAAIVNDDPAVAAALFASMANSSGGYDDAGSFATYVTNTGSTPVTVLAAGSAFVELQGTATVDGGDAPLFIVDASHDASDVELNAGSGTSFLIGGSGHDTLTGSTSATGHAIMVAGSGPTTITGGAGADSMYGGGNTTMTGGTGANQFLADYTVGAHDSITAGTGGTSTLAVAFGDNTLNDASGVNDTLYAGAGMDTLFGSTNGSTIALYQGNSSVQSAASDTINIATATTSHSDTITASLSGLDTVTFGGYSADFITSHEVVDSSDPTTVTINFGTTAGGVTQTATLHNISHITFGNG